MIAPDCIGYGLTPGRGSQDYPNGAQGEFLLKFIRALGIKKAAVGGNSNGGWLCQYLAHEAPDVVTHCIIINSLNGTRPVPPEPEGLRYIYGPAGHANEDPTEDRIREQLLRLYFHKQIVTEQRVKRSLEIASLNAQFMRARAIATSSTVHDANKNLEYRGRHMSEWAGELKAPVLMTWSRENTGSTPEQALAFFNRIRDVVMPVFIDAGHHLMTEHPERWSQVVASFVKNK